MKNKIIFSLILCAFILRAHPYALKSDFLQDKKTQETLQHEVKVNLVLVDVIVTKKGKFVTDLNMSDIELFEDGKKMPVNSLELISFAERKMVIRAEKDSEKVSPRFPAKKLAVVVDGVNSAAIHIQRGADKIIAEVLSLLELGNEVMIVQLHAKKGLEVLQPFTSDKALIRGAMEKAAGDIWVDKSLEALRMAQEIEDDIGEQAQSQRKLGKAEIAENLAHEIWKFEQNRFEISVGGILAVFHMLKDLPGRKSILLISSGIPELPSNRFVSRTRLAPPNVRFFDPFQAVTNKKNVEGQDVLKELIRFANAQNISIYTLDPGIFTEFFFTSAIEAEDGNPVVYNLRTPSVLRMEKDRKIAKSGNLRWMAEDTGAVWLRGAKKYESFRKVMETDLNYYYEISYYPNRSEPDNAYHDIKVKVKRSGVEVRHRKGYRDYSSAEEEKVLLASAFYYPELYKELPFTAEFIPFFEGSNRYKPWMSVALPVRKLFADKDIEFGSKVFSLHFWVKDNQGKENVYQGKMDIPFNIDSAFMDMIQATDYFSFHFTGPTMAFKQQEYQVVFALYDEQTEEIGTNAKSFTLPDYKQNLPGAIINCALGTLAENPEGETESFSLSKRGGSLKCGDLVFFPEVTHRFHAIQEASVFIQAYLPQGKDQVSPIFTILKESPDCESITGEMVAESWNEETKVWNGLFNLNLEDVLPGDYLLRISIPSSVENPLLNKDIKFRIIEF